MNKVHTKTRCGKIHSDIATWPTKPQNKKLLIALKTSSGNITITTK